MIEYNRIYLYLLLIIYLKLDSSTLTRVNHFIILLFCTTLLIGPKLCFGDQTTVDSLVQVLRNELKKQDLYDNSKRERIKKLNQELSETPKGNLVEQHLLTNQLLDEYISYQRDSAFNIANKLINISLKINDVKKINSAKLKLAKILITSGILKEASLCLDEINIQSDTRENKLEYYHLQKWLNWAMAVSIGDEYYFKIYQNKEAVYQDSAKMYANKDNYDYQLLGIFSEEERINRDKDFDTYLNLLDKYYHQDPHRAARLAYMLSSIYDGDKGTILMLIAAIFDVRNSIKETPAIIKVSRILFEEGDIDNAYYILQEALQNANFFGSRLHKLEISNLLPQVTAQKIVETERKIMTFIVISLLLIFIIIWFIYSRIKLKSWNEKISNKNIELQNLLQELEKSQRENSWILKVLAHDLRGTIAGSIHLYEIFIHNKNLSAEEKKMLELLEESNQDALQTISDLLHTKSDDKDVKKSNTELDKLILESTTLLQYKANEKSQKLITKLEPVTIPLNREKIRRVIDNLINNAIKFSSPSSEIHVEIVVNDADKVRIKIADNGIGIPEEFKSKIFEMSPELRREGTFGEESFGLGLYICKQIIDQHNGKIWIENNTHSGTIFFIDLPKM